MPGSENSTVPRSGTKNITNWYLRNSFKNKLIKKSMKQ
ncbi:MAG: hypothetical protein UT82_C0013G0014 [Parcubacteria group bacterium GW2011_GWB1_40_14]|nr:MAG: hypothetical protein UT82_C0013G0014 [Parcubacteria group bacterium GW2011_GWB1_40_14]